MVDLDVVARKIATATHRLEQVDELLELEIEAFLADLRGRDLTAFYLQLAIQDCVDLASHWVAEAGWPPPEDAGSAFDALADHDVIPRDLAAFLVDWRYLERPGNVVVEDGGGLDALTRWAEAGTAGGNQLWVQISHPGRQCSRMSNAHPVAPSAVQLKLGGFFGRPRALTEPEILEIIERYARTAGIVQRAGFTYERLKFLEEQDALDEAASTRRHLRSCAFRSLATESCWSSASRGSGRGSRRKR